MIEKSKKNKQFFSRKINSDDFEKLLEYLQHLSQETKSRFGPHPYDMHSIKAFYENSNKNTGYIAQNAETLEIISYFIIKHGYLEHDSYRLKSNGLFLDNKTVCTFAPSVADHWQSMGVGNSLFNFVLSILNTTEINRIILWGGVKCDNIKAVNFYKKHGFRILGKFEYNGWNYDMVLDLV